MREQSALLAMFITLEISLEIDPGASRLNRRGTGGGASRRAQPRRHRPVALRRSERRRVSEWCTVVNMSHTVLLLALVAVLARTRGELDPAACASRFDVQHDKIIRTEESRGMGARYLSELDVGARAECLRLCCETDACDVFVYEEKGPGSCYLFSCGPPEDFRCKFTAHSNFSSGVLALSRRLAELQDQELRAHRERELAGLRGGLSTATATSSTTTVSSTTSTTHTPSPPPPRPPHRSEPVEPPRRCSRYQFECRHGGECIAVYNACDGVPQCADGSDEAPELGCPAPLPLTTAPPARSPQEGTGESSERWPHRLAQALPPRRYTVPESSHIFSHKGGLLQEPETAPFPFEASWPRRAWPPPLPPAVGDDMRDAAGADMAAADRRWETAAAAGAGYWAEPDPRRAWPVPQHQSEPVPARTMPEVPVQYGGARTALRDQPKKGLVIPAETAATAPPVTSTSPPVSSTARAIRAEAHVDMHGAGKSEPLADGGAGLSERPPAAVLLLILGLLMTTTLGMMLACRVRAARRRLRRGKSPFAHDADYLVNGMYL